MLTDIDADRHYAACLTFYEDVVVEPPKIDDEDADEQDLALVRAAKLYAPKSLVLVSKLGYFETFRVSSEQVSVDCHEEDVAVKIHQENKLFQMRLIMRLRGL